jgi:hypothetical protein
MQFKVRDIDLLLGSVYEKEFYNVAEALIAIQDRGWDLNSKLYELMDHGFIQRDGGMVMLLGIYPGGTEDLICHSLIAGQMGRGPFPMILPPVAREVTDDNT